MKKATAVPFELQCLAAGLPKPKMEYRFHPTRKWRFDYAWPDIISGDGWCEVCMHQAYALEVEGGVFIAGRHSRGAGMVKDMEKYNAATLAGWRVLRVTPKQIADGSALALVERAIRS